MSQPVFSLRAQRDLRRIRRYIAAESGAERARAVIERIVALCRLFAEQPAAGCAHPELGREVRACISGSYLVFYVPRRGTIEVARLIDSRRDVLLAWREDDPSNGPEKRGPR